MNNPANDNELAYADRGKYIQRENKRVEVGVLCCTINWGKLSDQVAAILSEKGAQYTNGRSSDSCRQFERYKDICFITSLSLTVYMGQLNNIKLSSRQRKNAYGYMCMSIYLSVYLSAG